MKVESIILDYLKKENLFSKEVNNPKLEFGFLFSFPPGLNKVPMQVMQPKGNDFIVITLGIQIPDAYIKALNSLDTKKKNQFYFDIRKFLLLQNFLFNFDLQHYRYQLSDQIYVNQGEPISKNNFFKCVRKIYNSGQYCHMILAETCAEKVDSKELNEDLNPNFYT